MRPGVHYIFELTIGKKAIDKITASVVPWEEVTATASPTNARVTVNLLVNGTAKSGDADFDLYRSTDTNNGTINDDFVSYAWTTGYVYNKATLTGTGTYATDWYWPDNKTFYHFRAVSPKDHAVATNTTPDPDEDYISLTGEASYIDVCCVRTCSS